MPGLPPGLLNMMRGGPGGGPPPGFPMPAPGGGIRPGGAPGGGGPPPGLANLINSMMGP